MPRPPSSCIAGAASDRPWPPTTCRRWATPTSSPWMAACGPGARPATRASRGRCGGSPPLPARPRRTRSDVRRARPSAPVTLQAVREAIVGCEACPRQRTYCQRIAREKKAAHRDEVYWGKPVPGFGDPAARLLIVGLAPAAHGANRTGRVFTGDGSGDFQMRALRDAYIMSVVRCAPPDNKPTPEEIVRCNPHLAAEIAALPNVQIVVALGKIGWDGYLAFRRGPRPPETPRVPRPVFGHGAVAPLVTGEPLLM